MPATYAHYRFGAQMLSKMPADLRCTAKRNRRLFDVGLHGPDLLFYYKPAFRTKIGGLGSKFHRQTGKEFFARVCRNLRLSPSEEGQSYLYGVLCHYALDAQCHPLVEALVREGVATHTRIETAFDSFLMELDGKPDRIPLTNHMRLTGPECTLVSRFYPGTDAGHIHIGLKGMVHIRKVLEMPDGKLREALVKSLSLGSGTFRDMVANEAQDSACRKRNQPLLEKYQQAAKQVPDMLLQLSAHLTYNAPLGEEFDPIFG